MQREASINSETHPKLEAIREQLLFRWRELRRNQFHAAIGFGTGLFFGLVILGWWLWPVEWTDTRFEDLGYAEQVRIVEAAADLNAYDLTSSHVIRLMRNWDGDKLACQLSHQTADVNQRIRLVSLAYRVNGYGCDGN